MAKKPKSSVQMYTGSSGFVLNGSGLLFGLSAPEDAQVTTGLRKN